MQTYFDEPLPEATALAEALTFHAFEIEEIVQVENDEVLDVKVTANRGHDCLCHRGIAKELSAILNIPIKQDPLRTVLTPIQPTETISIEIVEPTLCLRYVAGLVKNITVGPSPDWLRGRLEAIGQKSINNVVDATNYVMFGLGQPLHAFDAGKLVLSDQLSASGEISEYRIQIRKARGGEKIVTLDNKEYELPGATLLIVDGNSDTPIGIAGVKGGMPASITFETTDIIIESASFEGASVRKAAQALKLRTDASARFEQVISPALAAYGMRAVVDLIVEVARGEVVGFHEAYPTPLPPVQVMVSTSRINMTLGTSLSDADVIDALRRLDLSHIQSEENFVVHVPFERLDLVITEDLIEEVGRIVGYDKVPATHLSPFAGAPAINETFRAAESVREDLIARGYSEVYTSVFADSGERIVLNKVDGMRPYLRANLIDGLSEALQKNARNKDFLGTSETKLFEIGTIWSGGGEEIVVGMVADGQKAEQKTLEAHTKSGSYENLPFSVATRFVPFSRYPFIVRDVALWTPAGMDPEEVLRLIKEEAGDLLVRISLFDTFQKEDRISLAFRLIFQSLDRTLTDIEVHAIMEKVYALLRAKGLEIR